MKIKNTANKVLASTKRKLNEENILSKQNKKEKKKQVKTERYNDVTKNIQVRIDTNNTNSTTVQ